MRGDRGGGFLTCWRAQETPAEFLALLGEAPGFHGLPHTVEMTRAHAQKLLKPHTMQHGGQDPAAAAAGGSAPDDAMQQGDDAAAAANGASADKPQPEAGAMDVDQAAAEGEQQQQQGDGAEQQQEPAEGQDPVALWSGRLLGVLQARFNPDHKPFSTEQVLLWIDQEEVGSAGV
jgi:hypothetical protein